MRQQPAAGAAIVREYIWPNGMPVMVVDDVNTATPTSLFVHTDHLRRPIRVTGGARATVWQATWTALRDAKYIMVEEGAAAVQAA